MNVPIFENEKKISDEDLQFLRDFFKQHDSDKDGQISVDGKLWNKLNGFFAVA